MLETCITNAGGTYLFCDTDSAAIVSTEQRQQITMPDGAPPITTLSHNEVDEIVRKFAKLNPHNRRLVPGSILKVHKLNWDHNQQRRQLYGYAIAAKRYALYTKTENDIEIVETKAHGLGYSYPPKDSPEGWKHETPQWIFEAWDWIVHGVLGLKRRKPSWFDLPVSRAVLQHFQSFPARVGILERLSAYPANTFARRTSALHRRSLPVVESQRPRFRSKTEGHLEVNPPDGTHGSST